MYNRYKQDTMIFWKGSIQKDRSARFTGKPTTKTCKRMYSRTVITTLPPPAGAPKRVAHI